MKNEVAYKNQNVYLKINSPLMYGTNQWDGFYTMATLY